MFNTIFNFLHTYRPQPVILKVGLFNLYWYGLLIVIAIFIGFWLTVRLAKKYQIKEEEIWNLSFYLVIFGLIGARIYHILSEIGYYWQEPLEVFYFWQGGLGIYGAIAAGVLVLYFFARKHQLSFWRLADILSPAMILGMAIGRWGNWFNQENIGQPTNLPWGIPIDWQNRPLEYLSNQYFHPAFLYQSIWNLFVFFILLFLIIYIFQYKEKPGLIFAWFMILYSIGRFIIEFIRINPQPMIFNLRLAQIVAILMFISGGLILFRRKPAST